MSKRLRPALDYAPSFVGGLGAPDRYDAVEMFCLFVGYPRSGHSLVGSLLNAHPDIVVSHELDALRYVGAGYRRNQLYWLILRRDAEFTKAGNKWRKFDYAVPGQWQGRYRRLRVIGDKKGGVTTHRLAEQPELLDRLARVVGVDVRVIHVIRNPFDNIATMSKRSHQTLEASSLDYFELCEIIERIRKKGSVIDVRHESLVSDPKVFLSSLCSDLGLSLDADYLSACADIVYERPHQSRHEVSWDNELMRSVQERMAGFGFLDGYSSE